MVTYLPRSAWGARASRGGTGLVAANVEGEALHWPGMTGVINAAGAAGQARVASALRGWQNYHMDSKGWSDIAYQIAIDQAGRAWTLRGLNIRSGANGDADVNRRFGAFLLVLGPGEQPSAAMKETVKAVITDFRRFFPHASAKPKGHRDVRAQGTDCPGPLAYAAIGRGEFTAGSSAPPPVQPPAKPPVTGGLSMADAASIENQIKALDAKLLGRYKRDEETRALTLNAIAAIASQIKTEDAADDAALAKAVADLKAAIDTPPPAEPPAPTLPKA